MVFGQGCVQCVVELHAGKNTHETKLSYSRKVSERWNVGTEFKYSQPEKESALHLACESICSHRREFRDFSTLCVMSGSTADTEFSFSELMVPNASIAHTRNYCDDRPASVCGHGKDCASALRGSLLV